MAVQSALPRKFLDAFTISNDREWPLLRLLCRRYAMPCAAAVQDAVTGQVRRALARFGSEPLETKTPVGNLKQAGRRTARPVVPLRPPIRRYKSSHRFWHPMFTNVQWKCVRQILNLFDNRERGATATVAVIPTSASPTDRQIIHNHESHQA